MATPIVSFLSLVVLLTAASALNTGATPSLFPSTGGKASLSYNSGSSIASFSNKGEQVTCFFEDGVQSEGSVTKETAGGETLTCPVPPFNGQSYRNTLSTRFEDGSPIQSGVPIVYYSKLKTVRVSPRQVSMFASTDVEVTLKGRSSPTGLDLLADATGAMSLAAAPGFCSFDGLRVPAKHVAFTEEPSDVQDRETGENALVTFVVTCASPPNLDVGAVTVRASLEGSVTAGGSARLTVSYSPDFNGAGAALDSFSNVAVLGGMDREEDEEMRWSRFLLEDNENDFDFYGPCTDFYGAPPGSPGSPGFGGGPPSVPGAPGSIPSGFPGSVPPGQPGVVPPGYPGSTGAVPPSAPGSYPPGSPGSNPPGSPSSPGGSPGVPGSPGGSVPPYQPAPGCTVHGCPEQKGDGGPYVPPPVLSPGGPLRAPAPAPGPAMYYTSPYSLFGIIAIGSGYLTACEICFDPTHSGTCLAADLTCTTDGGGLGSCTRTGDSLLFPEVTKQNTLTGVCVNSGTGLPLSIPLSSPTECAMVTSLTTVKQKMMETKLVTLGQSGDFLGKCFGLPAQPDVCNYNALEGILGAVTGGGSADVSAALILLTGSKLTSVSVLGSSLIGGPLGVVADLINTIISGKCMAANNVVTGGSRRLLDTGNLLGLEDTSFLLQVVNETVQAANLLQVGGLNNVSAAALQAVVSAMVVVNQKLQDLVADPSYAAALFGNATAAAEVLKRLYTIDVVSQTTFKDNIQALANGTLSLEQFAQATSSSAFEAAAAQVKLPASPGLPPSPAPTPVPTPQSPVAPPGVTVKSSKKNVGAIVGGVVGGFFGVALIAAAIAYFVMRRKKANARFDPLYPENATGSANGAGSYVPPTQASGPVTPPEETSAKRPSARAAPVQSSEGTSSKRPSVRVAPEDGAARRESGGPSSPV